MGEPLPIRRSSHSCAYVAKMAHSLGTHSPSDGTVQSLFSVKSALLPLQAAHMPTDFADTQRYIHPSAQVLLYLHAQITEYSCPSTHCTYLHAYATHGGITHPIPQLHPINTQRHTHKCHATAASISTSTSLAVGWGLCYAAHERPLGESTSEGCLLQRRLDIFKETANQLSKPFTTINTPGILTSAYDMWSNTFQVGDTFLSCALQGRHLYCPPGHNIPGLSPSSRI